MLNRFALTVFVLVALGSPAGAQPDGNPFMIDTSLVYVPANGLQYLARMAYGGTNYLAVWTDKRDGVDIYGTRVSPDGTVLDPGGIAIATIDDWESYPDVAFDGTNWLVVWEAGCHSEYSIYGARVNPDGTVLDDTGFVISAADERQFKPAVGFDGTNYLVAWTDTRNSSTDDDIYGARVTPSGQVLDTDGIAIRVADEDQGEVDVAGNGTNCLVVWQHEDPNEFQADVRGARVSPAGTVLDPGGFDISADTFWQKEPSLVSDGSDWFVVWADGRVVGLYDFRGARVNASGTVLDPDGILISPDTVSQVAPAIGFDGTNYFVAWEDNRGEFPYNGDVVGTRVSTTGTVLDPDGIVVSHQYNDEHDPAVGGGGGNFLVAWTDNRDPESDIYGTRVTGAGQVEDPDGLGLSFAGDYRDGPAVAYGEGQWLAAWGDYRSDRWGDLYGARVTTWDTVRDESGFAISTALGHQLFPAAAWGTSSWLVVWSDGRASPSEFDIYCSRVSASGQVLDPAGIQLCAATNYQYFPDVAFDGTNWLVVWEDLREGYDDVDIWGARVTQDGTVLDPGGVNITNDPTDKGGPALCFDGTNYLLAWNDEMGGSYDRVYAIRLSPDMTALDTAINVSGSSRQAYPDIAHDGTNWLVAWQDRRSNQFNVKAARVGPDGAVLDSTPIAVSTADGEQGVPDVTFDGFNWLVVWDHYLPYQQQQSDIWGARVTPDGQVLDSVLVMSVPGAQTAPKVADNGGFVTLMVYQDATAEYGGRTYNTRRTWGMFRPYPGVAEGQAPGVMEPALEARPNPFTRSTVLRLPGATDDIAIRIHDASGRLVRTLQTTRGSAIWDGRDESGYVLANGVYFCRMRAEGYPADARVILSR